MESGLIIPKIFYTTLEYVCSLHYRARGAHHT